MFSSVQEILQYCPIEISEAVSVLPTDQKDRLEEIRLRIGQNVTYSTAGKEWALLYQKKPILTDREMLESVFSKACSFSRYAAERTMQDGFFTVAGGHRIGICGTLQQHEGKWTMQDLSSLNLRVARQVTGFADAALNLLWTYPESTLILGPPGSGKTTLLREIVRQLSDRFQSRVSIVDERGEIAAVVNGLPQFAVGRYTDVLTGAEKDKGISILLRTMRPDWIAVDEITQERDLDAMEKASYCGVQLLASAHAFRRCDLSSRPLYRKMMQLGLFRNLIVIDRNRNLQCERVDK